jgi:hypothetical protein
VQAACTGSAARKDDHVPRVVPGAAPAATRLERLLTRLSVQIRKLSRLTSFAVIYRTATQRSARIASGPPASAGGRCPAAAHSRRSLPGSPLSAGRLVEASPRGFLGGALDCRARSRELCAARGKRRAGPVQHNLGRGFRRCTECFAGGRLDGRGAALGRTDNRVPGSCYGSYHRISPPCASIMRRAKRSSIGDARSR